MISYCISGKKRYICAAPGNREKKENAYIFRGDNQFSDEYGIKREQMIGRVTEIIRGDEVIPVNDIKHRMWAGFWVNTVFFRRVKRFCLKCRKKKKQ